MKEYNVYFQEEHHLVMADDYVTELLVCRILARNQASALRKANKELWNKGYRIGVRDTGRDNYVVGKVRVEEI